MTMIMILTINNFITHIMLGHTVLSKSTYKKDHCNIVTTCNIWNIDIKLGNSFVDI